MFLTLEPKQSTTRKVLSRTVTDPWTGKTLLASDAESGSDWETEDDEDKRVEEEEEEEEEQEIVVKQEPQSPKLPEPPSEPAAPMSYSSILKNPQKKTTPIPSGAKEPVPKVKKVVSVFVRSLHPNLIRTTYSVLGCQEGEGEAGGSRQGRGAQEGQEGGSHHRGLFFPDGERLLFVLVFKFP